MRKAVVTRAAEQSATPTEREALAAHMCHDLQTAERHYDKSGRLHQKAAGYALSQALLRGEKSATGGGSPAVGARARTRRGYTAAEEEFLAGHFADAVERGRPPVAAEAREFLHCYPENFRARSVKDIIDKIRSMIRKSI